MEKAATQHLLEPCPGAETLVVAFTSYGADGAPAKGFEWQAVLRDYPVHKLFLRDERQHWYLGGVRGFSTSMEETADRALAIAAELGAERIITIGSSMGAHGALHLASLVGAECLAFSPIVDVIGRSAPLGPGVDRLSRNRGRVGGQIRDQHGHDAV